MADEELSNNTENENNSSNEENNLPPEPTLPEPLEYDPGHNLEVSFDPPENDSSFLTVNVTYSNDEVTFSRSVNAVVTNGEYDPELTKVRVDEVGRGVENKIRIGLIRNPDTSNTVEDNVTPDPNLPN